MRKEAEKNMAVAQEIFEHHNDSYLLSTVVKERGEMSKEFHELEQAQAHFENCLRLRRKVYPLIHTKVEKVYMKIADTYLRGRDEDELKKAENYLKKDEEFLRKIYDSEEFMNKSLVYAISLIFKARLEAKRQNG